MNPGSLTILFPAFNDGGTIGSQVITALQLLPRITDDFEILVVNDGSRDHTADVLEELSRRYPCLRVIHHHRNRGYGAALRTGFAAAQKEWIFYTDGDAQYDPNDLLKLLVVWNENIDVVNGFKIARNDPLHRKILGRLYHYFVVMMFRVRVHDVDCDFRLMRRSALDAIELESETGTICVEMIKKFQDGGYRIVEVPVPHYHRSYGRSQFFQFRRLCRVLIQLVRLWWKLVAHRPSPAALRNKRPILTA